MLVKYIGRESHFHGKSLYEIARNLKNFGEGRYVYRVSFSKRYKEPSFYKLTSVTPDMNAKGYCRGEAAGEKIFRGWNFGICKIEAGMKHDWRLIPKDQEQAWLDALKNTEVQPPKVIKSTGNLPALMELVVRDELLSAGLPVNKETLTYNVHLSKSKFSLAILDKDVKQSAVDAPTEKQT